MLLALVAVFAIASAKCPSVQVFQNFKPALYLGQWYEIAASPLVRETFERDCFCTNARYGVNSNSTISGGPTARANIIHGWASNGNGTDAAKLRVHLDGHGGNYWVMHVDVNSQGLYDNAIVWSCESVVVNLEWMWILSRVPNMPQSTYKRLTTLAAQLVPGYDAPNKLIQTVQSNCTYQ